MCSSDITVSEYPEESTLIQSIAMESIHLEENIESN